MSKLRKVFTLDTAYGTYSLDEQIGAGGAGIVYGGKGPSNEPIAVKALNQQAASSDKRRRFKNEIAFLSRHSHPHVVTVVDSGFSTEGPIKGPFYVMKRYDGSLRDVMRSGISSDRVLPLFYQILHGIETAHMLGAVHRDLKPENILWDAETETLAVADFGVAALAPDVAATVVETVVGQRLGNVMYAAPEQRDPGRTADVAADIFALGMMLNEMFTGEVPHGEDHRTIASVAPSFGYLDALVGKMRSQAPTARPATIAALKSEMERLGTEVVIQQKISEIDGAVVYADEIDNPLAHEPPKVVGADWADGTLTIVLDRPVNEAWVEVLKFHLGNFASVVPPQMFQFRGDRAFVEVPGDTAARVLEFFKPWLPQATQNLHHRLTQEANRRKADIEVRLRRERAREEERLKVVRSLRI